MADMVFGRKENSMRMLLIFLKMHVKGRHLKLETLALLYTTSESSMLADHSRIIPCPKPSARKTDAGGSRPADPHLKPHQDAFSDRQELSEGSDRHVQSSTRASAVH